MARIWRWHGPPNLINFIPIKEPAVPKSWMCIRFGSTNDQRFCPNCGRENPDAPREVRYRPGSENGVRSILKTVLIVVPAGVIGLAILFSALDRQSPKAKPVDAAVAEPKRDSAPVERQATETPPSAPLISAPSSDAPPSQEPAQPTDTAKDGCDDEVRSRTVKVALLNAFPPDPLDAPAAPLPRLDATVLLLPGENGEPRVVRDVSLAASDTPVCIYSDESLAVYVPSSLFTARMRALMMGARRPHDTFLGLPMPQGRFEALTYWSFKKPRAEEFAWVDNADRYRYEARQVTFDTDKKVFLFTSDILTDERGFIIAK
jgi:hypothetical protein